MKKIFATEERRNILTKSGIKYKVDDELNFIFNIEAEKKKAIKILKGALAL